MEFNSSDNTTISYGTGTGTGISVDDGTTLNGIAMQVIAPENDGDYNQTVTFKTVPQLAVPLAVEDAGGNLLKIGNIVKTLSPFNVAKALPPHATQSDVTKISNKFGTVHDINENENSIYLEIHDPPLQCVTFMGAGGTIFSSEGMREVIGDGSYVRIGDFVQVISSVEEVWGLTGMAGWIQGMEEACGKTGKVVRILHDGENGDGDGDTTEESNIRILVQFGWGSRIYFKSGALLQSYSDKVDTKDSSGNGNWISVGSVVLVQKSLPEFIDYQKKNQLHYDDEAGAYNELPFKICEVKEIQIKAFSATKTVQILYNGNSYLVNVEVIQLIDSIRDRNGNELRVGDQVRVINNETELKLLQLQLQQNSMNENDDMVETETETETEDGAAEERDEDEVTAFMGQTGIISEFCYIDDRSRSGSGSAFETDGGNELTELNTAVLLVLVLVKVEFQDLNSSYCFNPKAIEIFRGSKIHRLVSVRDEPKNFAKNADADVNAENVIGENTSKDLSTSTWTEEEWEDIDRNTLECEEQIGEGGFGLVVKGFWRKNETDPVKVVAVKQIKLGVTNKPGLVEQFMKEAKIQFSLRHPNIIALLGISLEGNRDLWIVMDFVDGSDLQSIIFPTDNNDDHEDDSDKESKILPFDEKLRMCVDMSKAMEFIHQQGYVHCDIKPANMMVDREGKLYICDFGITRHLGNMDIVSFATQYTNNVGGTLYYISPECLQTNPTTGKYRKPTFAADIFALGIIFYELFTEKHLYDRHMRFITDKASNNDKYVKERLPDLPEQVLPIVSKALDFDRTPRPSAKELSAFFQILTMPTSL